jgi:hypothetical protein
MRRFLPLLGLLALGSCTQAQFNSATSAIAIACADAMPLVPLALGIPTVGPFVAAGVQVACGTNAGLAKLAADPSSAEWLGQQIAIMKAALGA